MVFRLLYVILAAAAAANRAFHKLLLLFCRGKMLYIIIFYYLFFSHTQMYDGKMYGKNEKLQNRVGWKCGEEKIRFRLNNA